MNKISKYKFIKRFGSQLANMHQPYGMDVDIDFLHVGTIILAENGKEYTVINPHILGAEVKEGRIVIDNNLLTDKNNVIHTEWRDYKNPPYVPDGIMCSILRYNYAKHFGYTKEQCLGDRYKILGFIKRKKIMY